MKLRIFAAPAIIIAAIALLGVAVAGLLPAIGVLASASADGQGETPTPVPAVESTAEPVATSTPVPLKLPAAPDKSEPPASPADRSAKGTTSEVEGSGEGTAYTWEDGEGSGKTGEAVTANAVGSTTMGSVIGDRYDADQNGMISSSEVLRAVKDYFDDKITPTEVLAVVKLYFSGAPPPTGGPRGPDEWTVDNPVTFDEIVAELQKFRGSEIRASSYGGAYQAAQRKAFFEPFTGEFGIGIVEFTNSSNDLIRSQAETGNLLWDAVVTTATGIESLCGDGLAEELDFSIIDNRHLLEIAKSPCTGGPEISAAHVLAYSTETYPEGSVQPSSWADFFDVDRFPGRRLVRSDWIGSLWHAHIFLNPDLLDAGNQAGRDAAMSLTPAEVDASFEVWKNFSEAGHISGYWRTGSQCPQFLIIGEADMCYGYNGRHYDAQQKGAPIKICWECGFANDTGGWTVPKGLAAQDPDQFYLTQLFLAWGTFPQINVRISEFIAYPPYTTLAAQYLADPKYDAVRGQTGLSEENLPYAIMMDPEWGGPLYEQLQERWRAEVMRQ